MSLSDEVVDRWQSSTQTIGFERFCQGLWDNVFVQFVFGATGDPASIHGLVKCELVNFRHQTGQIAIWSTSEAQGSALPMMAMATLVDFVFSTYPIRKLYAEVSEYNYGQFSSGEGNLFEVEGRLIDHELHFGETWDTFILGIDRGHWAILQSWITTWRRP